MDEEGGGSVPRPSQDVVRRRQGLQARGRQRRHRRDHVVHQHVEPERTDRRRLAGAERPRQGADHQAVGEDLARARLAGRHRLPRPRRPAGRSRRARLQPRRLRLHDLHRQLRTAARGDLRRDQPQGSGRRFRAFRQPQLRGPRQSGHARQLSRLAAAGRRLRAHRHDAPESDHRAARHRPGRQAGDRSRTSGRRRRKSPTSSGRPSPTRCSARATPTSSRATSAGRRSPSPADRPTTGPPDRPTCRTRPTSSA